MADGKPRGARPIGNAIIAANLFSGDTPRRENTDSVVASAGANGKTNEWKESVRFAGAISLRRETEFKKAWRASARASVNTIGNEEKDSQIILAITVENLFFEASGKRKIKRAVSVISSAFLTERDVAKYLAAWSVIKNFTSREVIFLVGIVAVRGIALQSIGATILRQIILPKILGAVPLDGVNLRRRCCLVRTPDAGIVDRFLTLRSII